MADVPVASCLGVAYERPGQMAGLELADLRITPRPSPWTPQRTFKEKDFEVPYSMKRPSAQ